MEKTCLWCNGVYKTYNKKQKYCDTECQRKAHSQVMKNKHPSPATEFKKGHSWLSATKKKMVAHIRIAAEKKRDPDNRPIITCPTCHKSFSDFKSNNRRFCSRLCYEKFPKSEDSRRKMGEHHRSMKGASSPSWKGGPVLINCEICGKEKYFIRSEVENGRGRFCSNKCRGVWVSKTRKGKYTASAASNWKGGISFEPYDPRFNRQLRELIRLRDGYKCQKCGCPEIENGRKLSVHHIDGDKSNSSPTNLISLCIGCNTQVECNRPHWQRIFRRKVQRLMSAHPLQLNLRVTKSHGKNRSQGRSS